MCLVVYGKEDTIDADVEVDEDEEPILRPDEPVAPTNDILVRGIIHQEFN